MKTYLFPLLLLLAIVNVQAQESEIPSVFKRKHEIRLGVVKLLASGIVEGSYEHIINSNQGFGVSLFANFDTSKHDDWFETYSVTPYYRMYFQTNEDYGAKGFFVEGFGSLFATEYHPDENINNAPEVGDIALGLSLGKKWINTSGFIFEFKLGVGRNILGNAQFDALIKGDAYIGYRF